MKFFTRLTQHNLTSCSYLSLKSRVIDPGPRFLRGPKLWVAVISKLLKLPDPVSNAAQCWLWSTVFSSFNLLFLGTFWSCFVFNSCFSSHSILTRSNPGLSIRVENCSKNSKRKKVKKKKRLVAFFSFLLAMVNLFFQLKKKKARVTVREWERTREKEDESLCEIKSERRENYKPEEGNAKGFSWVFNRFTLSLLKSEIMRESRRRTEERGWERERERERERKRERLRRKEWERT